MIYSDDKAENVRFSRLVMMLLALTYALFTVIEAMYAVWVLTLLALILGINKSVTSIVLKLLKKMGLFKYFSVNARCRRSYEITRVMEFFEEAMRLSMASLVIFLDYNDYTVAATSLAFMMGMFMTISTYFGFCMSSIGYIIFQHFFGNKHGIK